MLNQRVRELRESGLLEAEGSAGYGLTPLGRELIDQVLPLVAWWLRAHAARARADRSGAAAGRLVGALGRRAHSRSRNPSVIALISGMPVRAIALMRAFTSAIGRNGFFASSPA